MSQPDPTTPTPPRTGGAAALEMAATRRKRHTPTAKVGKPSPAEPAATETGPEAVDSGPTEAPEGQPTGETVPTPEAPTERPVAKAQPKAAEPRARADEAPVAPVQEQPPAERSGTKVVLAPAQPNFSRMLRPKAPDLAPAVQAMYSDRITKLAKSLRNIMDMFAARWDEYEQAVHMAREARFPEEEIQRLAVQFQVEAPIPRGEAAEQGS